MCHKVKKYKFWESDIAKRNQFLHPSLWTVPGLRKFSQVSSLWTVPGLRKFSQVSSLWTVPTPIPVDSSWT